MDAEFDAHIYGPRAKFEGYDAFIPTENEEKEQHPQSHSHRRDLVQKMSSYTAPKHLISELQAGPRKEDEENDNNGQINKAFGKRERIIDRENDYRRRRLNRKLSPPRHDPFAAGDRSPCAEVSTYADVMREQTLIRHEHETLRFISQKRKQDGFDFREKQSETKFKSHENKSGDVKEIKYSQEKRSTHSSRRRQGFDFREKQSETKFKSHEDKSGDVKEIKYSQKKTSTHSSRSRHKLSHSSKDKCS